MTNYDKEQLDAVKYICNDLNAQPQKEILSEVAKVFKTGVGYYIYGGYIRDLLIEYFHARTLQKHDLDIIVDVADPLETFIRMFSGTVDRTPLGGYRWYPNFANDKYVDIWQIQENINIRINKLSPSIENALKGPAFNVNRICFDVKNMRLIDNGAIDGIKQKIIVYYPNQEKREHFHAARAIMLKDKTSFELDSSVIQLILGSNWQNKKKEIEQYLALNKYSSSKVSAIFEQLNKYSE